MDAKRRVARKTDLRHVFVQFRDGHQMDFACTAAPEAGTPHQRAVGRVQVGVRRGPGGSVLHTLHQAGCLKARFPKVHGGGMEAVLINTSGGVVDGDRLTIAVEAGEGSALTVCTPSAERIYRARQGAKAARIEVQASVGAGACLEYLPQETLFFDGCALDRSLRVDMHAQGRFLGVEALLFGRTLSGEVVRSVRLRDNFRLFRGGRLALRDGVRLSGDVQGVLGARASAAGARAVATIFYAGPDAEGFLAPVRAALEGAAAHNGCGAGAVARRKTLATALGLIEFCMRGEFCEGGFSAHASDAA
jgi:urease accessory protein